MISTHWRAVHQPSARELRLLDVLTRQAADLIERKEAEDALHESKERLRAALAEATAAREQYTHILENMTGGFTTFDAKWRITYVNATTEQVTNRRREDMLDKIFWEEFPDSLGTIIEAEYRRPWPSGYQWNLRRAMPAGTAGLRQSYIPFRTKGYQSS